MRAAPPFQITVQHFGHWRWRVAWTSLAALVSVLVWLPRAWHERQGLAIAVLGVTGLVVAWVMVSAFRLRPTSLRWDSQTWHCGPAATRGAEPHPVRLRVTWDGGAWLLLRLVDEDAGVLSHHWRSRWLPVQQQGHEVHWHALRCTVYSPRPLPPSHLSPSNDPTPE